MKSINAYRYGAIWIILSLIGLQAMRFFFIKGEFFLIRNEEIIREKAGWPYLVIALVFVVTLIVGITWFLRGKGNKDPLGIQNILASELRSRRNTLLILVLGFLLITSASIFMLKINLDSQNIPTSTELASALFAAPELYTAIVFFLLSCFVGHKAGRQWGKLDDRIEKDPLGVEE